MLVLNYKECLVDARSLIKSATAFPILSPLLVSPSGSCDKSRRCVVNYNCKLQGVKC